MNVSYGEGLAHDVLDIVMDIISTESPLWCEEAGALGIARRKADSEDDLFRHKVHGSAVALYMCSTGRIRTLSVWTLAAMIVGDNILTDIARDLSIIKQIDPEMHETLKPWTSVSQSERLYQHLHDRPQLRGILPEPHPAISFLESHSINVNVRTLNAKFPSPPDQHP